jgi:hypothetical protein
MNKPCKDDYFVELEILGAQITPKDIEDYEQAMEKYEDDMSDWELNQEINSLRGLQKPKAPNPLGSDLSYTKLYINLGYLVIRNWTSDFDTINNEEIIVAQTVDPDTGISEHLNIKMSKEKWLNLLNELGATIV